MPITLDAASHTHFDAVSGTLSHTCGGTSRLLIVISSTNNIIPTQTATYNGVSMTEAHHYKGLHVFYMIDPPVGAHNIVITNSSSRATAVASASFNGVSQTSPIGTPTQSSGTSISGIASESSDLVLGAIQSIVGGGGGSIGSDGAGQTRVTTQNTWGLYTVGVAGSTKDGASPSVSMSWTAPSTSNCIGFAIKPADSGKQFQAAVIGL